MPPQHITDDRNATQECLQSATLRGVQTQHDNSLHEDLHDTFIITTYNAHSVMADGRFEAILQELVGIEWDTVTVVETWREAQREQIQLGHIWYGSGGCRGMAGVGFIVNERVQGRYFTSISERLVTIDINYANDKIKILGLYMPDASYSDNDVNLVYAQLDENYVMPIRSGVAASFVAI